LSSAELAEFKHVLETAPMVLLTGCDQRLIENYCVAVAAAREAAEKLSKTGKLIAGANGPTINPFWKLWRQASNDARMMGNELGLSPAARARLSVEPEKPQDPMELLLGDDMDPAGAWSAIGARQ
jgi:P27 family predicted phage terminase small subunit